ncbi:MAG: ribbon-helix-helix domain-containing protein [Methanoregula sp.]|jgi:metal-responsive CopG/Arc/MetJ family transcriptional regulator|uniref:ribbon-helix-helix domain-containing protein n=1 Tax=Methanoregula sp. TaxID=2052170 RepID=UPI003D124D1E
MVSFPDKDKTEYVKIGMPKEMVEEVKRIIEGEKRLGFVSIQEFVKDAVRKNIMEFGEYSNGQHKR